MCLGLLRHRERFACGASSQVYNDDSAPLPTTAPACGRSLESRIEYVCIKAALVWCARSTTNCSTFDSEVHDELCLTDRAQSCAYCVIPHLHPQHLEWRRLHGQAWGQHSASRGCVVLTRHAEQMLPRCGGLHGVSQNRLLRESSARREQQQQQQQQHSCNQHRCHLDVRARQRMCSPTCTYINPALRLGPCPNLLSPLPDCQKLR